MLQYPKTNACSFPRVVVIVFQKRMVVLDAGSLDNKYVIRSKSFKTPIAYDHTLSICRQLPFRGVSVQPCCPGNQMVGLLRNQGTPVQQYYYTWLHFNKRQVTKFNVFYVLYSCRLSTRVWGVCQMPRPPPWPPPCSRTSRRASQLSVSAHYMYSVGVIANIKRRGRGY